MLLGSPGLGKSRLIEEFTRRLGDAATVITAQCDADGGATFAPVAEALRAFLGAHDGQVPLLTKEGLGEVALPPTPPPPGPLLGKEGEESTSLRSALEAATPLADAERIRIVDGISALLAGSPASPEETFFIIRRFLAALAETRPVVLVIDDLHWAEPLLLELVEHLVQWGSGVPLLVLIGARPELRDLRSSLVTPGGLVSDVVTLSGLDAGAAMRLAANVIGAADLPAAVAAKVLATSEGNPLFVSELVRMLVDEGAIERQGERWVVGANLASLEMPPTIHALLAARIERLRPEERTVLERAAVVGRHFSRSAVAALLGRNGSELDARLEALRRTELIERDTGWFLGEPLLRFHHVLIRDAAYRRLLKGTRADLHEHLADWIEAQVKDAPRTPEASGGRAEHDETIGWHLEQAHQHLRELGPLDAHGTTLGERAAQRLAAAGRRSLARDDLPVAAGLLGRAIDRLDSDDPARAELALDWCEALLVRRVHSGTERLGGGCYERPFLVLFTTDPDGRLARAEWFDADHEAEALARFDELGETSERLASPLLTKEGARGRLLTQQFETSPDPSLVRRGTDAGPFDNAASRADRRLFECFNARDWAGVEALAGPDLVFDERRRMVRNTCGRDTWLEQFRVLFDLEDQDAAYAELDARYDAGEGAAPRPGGAPP